MKKLFTRNLLARLMVRMGWTALSVYLMAASLNAIAETAEDKGIAIAKEQKQRDNGWGDSQSEITMVLRAADGAESTRIIHVQALEKVNDGDKSLMVFDQPKDVEGTALLSFSHIVGDDEQWVYLPALKRVKRISSNSKSSSFMGSEFSYEDLNSFEIERYTFKYIREEVFNGEKCFVVESRPKDENSGYTRVVSWIDQSEYLVHKAEFYDKKDMLLKVLDVKNYQKFNAKFWRPSLSSMSNKQTGKSTDLRINNLRLKTGLKDENFSQNNLKRAM